MSFNYSPKIVNDNSLVLYLDAANTKSYPGSGTTWSDLSRGGNNGTLVNGPSFSSLNMGSLVFNGTNSYVNCGNILNYTSGNFSFSYWIYVNSLTTNQSGQGPIILFKGQYQVNGYYDQINTSGAIGFNTNTNGAIVGSGTGAGVILTGRTYNICYTRNGSSIRVYVNGVDVTTYAGNHLDPVSSSSNFLINSYNVSIFSNVRTYSFMNYNRALSAAEVLQNFNATKTRYGL